MPNPSKQSQLGLDRTEVRRARTLLRQLGRPLARRIGVHHDHALGCAGAPFGGAHRRQS